MSKSKSKEDKIEVLGQTGVLDVVPAEDKRAKSKKKRKKSKKVMTMNLKTLFALGIGAVILLCGIIAIIVSLAGTKYTVKFDTAGGSKIASIRVKKGHKIEKPKDPTKKEYTFVEWQLNGKKYDFSKKVTKNITLKAKWDIALTDDVYTITFDTKGGTEIEQQQVNGNGRVVKPEDPTRVLSRFVEWQLNGKAYDFDSLVNEDITLVALWEVNPTHDVKFDYDGGGKNYSQVVYEGDYATIPTEKPSKEGFKFVEWQKDGQKYNFETPVIDDITLKAKYTEAKQYEIKFDSNGGTAISSQFVYEGGLVIKPTDPTKTNYSFGGWQLNGKDYDFNTEVSKNITLKAKWEEVKTCRVDISAVTNLGNVEQTLRIKCGTKISLKQVNDSIKSYCESLHSKDCSKIQYGTWFYSDASGMHLDTKYDFNGVVSKDITIWSNINIPE